MHIAARLRQAILHKLNSHLCSVSNKCQKSRFAGGGILEYMRAAGISSKVPDIPDIHDDTLEEDFDKRFNMEIGSGLDLDQTQTKIFCQTSRLCASLSVKVNFKNVHQNS